MQTGLKNKPGYFLTLENPYYVQAWPFQGMFLSVSNLLNFHLNHEHKQPNANVDPVHHFGTTST